MNLTNTVNIDELGILQSGTSLTWTSPQSTSGSLYTDARYSSSLIFDIDGESIEFNSQEIIRLKEMLTGYIKKNHPEDLL